MTVTHKVSAARTDAIAITAKAIDRMSWTSDRVQIHLLLSALRRDHGVDAAGAALAQTNLGKSMKAQAMNDQRCAIADCA